MAKKIVGLVQAHHRGWAGAMDLSLARVGGKYAVEEVIDRLLSMPSIDAVTIAVPDDPGNEIFREIATARGVSPICSKPGPSSRWTILPPSRTTSTPFPATSSHAARSVR